MPWTREETERVERLEAKVERVDRNLRDAESIKTRERDQAHHAYETMVASGVAVLSKVVTGSLDELRRELKPGLDDMRAIRPMADNVAIVVAEQELSRIERVKRQMQDEAVARQAAEAKQKLAEDAAAAAQKLADELEEEKLAETRRSSKRTAFVLVLVAIIALVGTLLGL